MNYDPVRMAFHEELTKPMICNVCSQRLTDPHTLRRHMLEEHQQADFQIQDSNYYNLPEVKSVLNRCIPCGRQFAQAVLYRLHVKNKHASKEPQENINDAARLAAIYQNAAMAGMPGMPSAHHNRVPLVQTPGVVLPPGISISAVTPAQAAQKKSLQCLVCHRAFMTQSALMSHMLVHQAGMGGVPGGMQMSQQAYLALPSVESTMNRCLPCLKSFPSSLRYKIHVKDEHKGVEPMENYDPEKCVQPDDFICLICIKKFKNRNGLKLHIQNFHLAGSSLKHLSDEKPEKEEEDKAAEEKVAAVAAEGKSEASDEKDPLADPLADPLDTSQDETKEEPVSKSEEKKEEPSEKSGTQVEEQSQNSSENKEESSKEASASIEEKKENSEEVSSKDGEADDKKDETDNKEPPTTVDEEEESKKA